ncbi:unnamed protein product [Tuber melanosporum]|uniref:(Perigord truffle) hypothetical protein n=1 Tax=Tuber melanosporum (strain Mel28) TaxID=656061 RepID=D5GI32_TUBMM|nr:uncharacterized protein GSTUM_00008247001 [Tuber melanosporum]CAZ84175.1 unnamed protein product [Tuber melanosporum]
MARAPVPVSRCEGAKALHYVGHRIPACKHYFLNIIPPCPPASPPAFRTDTYCTYLYEYWYEYWWWCKCRDLNRSTLVSRDYLQGIPHQCDTVLEHRRGRKQFSGLNVTRTARIHKPDAVLLSRCKLHGRNLSSCSSIAVL